MTTGVADSPNPRSDYSHHKTKIDWNEAREYYLKDSDVTLDMVAEKYDLARKTVSKWASREKWFQKRRDAVAERNLEVANRRAEETERQVNERHLDSYRQMQQFIKTNMAIAQGYIREKYLEAEKEKTSVNKKDQYSAQNIKYMSEAYNIAINGERGILGYASEAPKKSEKDIKVSGQLSNYSRSQIEALFVTGGELAKEMDVHGIIDG